MFKTVFKNHVQYHIQNHVQNCVKNHAQNHVQNHVQNHIQKHVQNHIQNHVKTMFETMLKDMLKTMLKTMFKTIFKFIFKTAFEKLKKMANKNMSFIKITDHKKRNFIANEFLKTRQTIQQNVLSERVGDLNTRTYELSKLFKPVTDVQKDLKEGLVSELIPIGEGMKNLPKAITFPQFPSITVYDDDDGEEEDTSS